MHEMTNLIRDCVASRVARRMRQGLCMSDEAPGRRQAKRAYLATEEDMRGVCAFSVSRRNILRSA